jgi:hypothetical protein
MLTVVMVVVVVVLLPLLPLPLPLPLLPLLPLLLPPLSILYSHTIHHARYTMHDTQEPDMQAVSSSPSEATVLGDR